MILEDNVISLCFYSNLSSFDLDSSKSWPWYLKGCLESNSLMWFFFFSNQSDCPLRVTKERAVCADKIMFSDLRSQQLRKTMEIKVFAVHFHRAPKHYRLFSLFPLFDLNL